MRWMQLAAHILHGAAVGLRGRGPRRGSMSGGPGKPACRKLPSPLGWGQGKGRQADLMLLWAVLEVSDKAEANPDGWCSGVPGLMDTPPGVPWAVWLRSPPGSPPRGLAHPGPTCSQSQGVGWTRRPRPPAHRQGPPCCSPCR